MLRKARRAPARVLQAHGRNGCVWRVAFSVEQIFLTDHTGKLLPERAAAHHIVEADTLDDALAAFLRRHDASVLGTVQRFPSGQAVATAQQDQTVFTVHVVAGDDVFEREPRSA